MTHSRVQKARTAGGRRAKGRPRVRTAKIAHRTQRQDVNRGYTVVQATSRRRPQAVLIGPAGRALSPGSPTHTLFIAACAAAGYEPRIVFRVNDCEMHQAIVAAGVGVGFLPRLALHPVHPGVVDKPVAGAPRRRILAITLPRVRNGAAEVFLGPPRSVRGRLPDATRTGSGLARPSRSVLLSPATQSDHTAAQTTRACKGRPAEVPLGQEPSHPVHRHDVRAIGGSSRGVAVVMRHTR